MQERVRSFEELALQQPGAADDESSGQEFLAVVDKDRMAQVFDNIIQNALEAMADHGGTLSVTLTSQNNEV